MKKLIDYLHQEDDEEILILEMGCFCILLGVSLFIGAIIFL
jgi:hypothetical protein